MGLRVMGLDIGKKRIGVALSDELKIVAQPLKVIPASPKDKALGEILRLAKELKVSEVVVGLPKSKSGELGESAQEALSWVEALKKEASFATFTWDERFTTKAVERTLALAGVKGAKKKELVDKLAACYLLQGYLDFRAKRKEA